MRCKSATPTSQIPQILEESAHIHVTNPTNPRGIRTYSLSYTVTHTCDSLPSMKFLNRYENFACEGHAMSESSS